MAFRTASLAPTNSTDANFRAWINEIHNALIAFGWVRTADTGQIDYAAVTRPTAINTYQGYAVYRMADSLQATCAVFLRLDYGTGAATDACSIKIRVTIGGTDGAGNLTGNAITQQIAGASFTASATAVNLRTSGTSSSFRFFWGMEVDIMFGFAIERDRDTTGAETSLGLNVLMLLDRGTARSQFIETAGGLGALDTKWYALISAQPSQSGGGVVGIAPVRTQLGPFRNPMIGILIYSKTDYTTNTTNPVSIYGVSRTYLMITGTTSVALNILNATCAVAMLFE